MSHTHPHTFVLQTSDTPDVFKEQSDDTNGAMAEPGTSIGVQSDNRLPTAEIHRHWIVADPVIIQILVQRQDIEVHCIAHDEDIDHAHYHVYFSQYKKGKQPDVKTIDFDFRDFFSELSTLLDIGYDGIDQKLRKKLDKYWKRVSITHEFNMKLHYTWICQSQGHCFGQLL